MGERIRKAVEREAWDERPPFITTVTKGRFLPSKFELLLQRTYFTFSSPPRPVRYIHPAKLTPHSSPSVRSGVKSSSYTGRGGSHEYFNLMWDPRVVRGTTIKIKSDTVNDLNANASQQVDLNKSGRGRKVGKKGPSVYRSRNDPTKLNHHNIPRKEPRAGHFEFSNQTAQFLEEFGNEFHAEPVNASVQTEKEYKYSPPRHVCSSSGVHASTQILPGEIVSDSEEEEVLQSLLQRVLHQGLWEAVEEEELLSIQEQETKIKERLTYEAFAQVKIHDGKATEKVF